MALEEKGQKETRWESLRSSFASWDFRKSSRMKPFPAEQNRDSVGSTANIVYNNNKDRTPEEDEKRKKGIGRLIAWYRGTDAGKQNQEEIGATPWDVDTNDEQKEKRKQEKELIKKIAGRKVKGSKNDDTGITVQAEIVKKKVARFENLKERARSGKLLKRAWAKFQLWRGRKTLKNIEALKQIPGSMLHEATQRESVVSKEHEARQSTGIDSEINNSKGTKWEHSLNSINDIIDPSEKYYKDKETLMDKVFEPSEAYYKDMENFDAIMKPTSHARPRENSLLGAAIEVTSKNKLDQMTKTQNKLTPKEKEFYENIIEKVDPRVNLKDPLRSRNSVS